MRERHIPSLHSAFCNSNFHIKTTRGRSHLMNAFILTDKIQFILKILNRKRYWRRLLLSTALIKSTATTYATKPIGWLQINYTITVNTHFTVLSFLCCHMNLNKQGRSTTILWGVCGRVLLLVVQYHGANLLWGHCFVILRWCDLAKHDFSFSLYEWIPSRSYERCVCSVRHIQTYCQMTAAEKLAC